MVRQHMKQHNRDDDGDPMPGTSQEENNDVSYWFGAWVEVCTLYTVHCTVYHHSSIQVQMYVYKSNCWWGIVFFFKNMLISLLLCVYFTSNLQYNVKWGALCCLCEYNLCVHIFGRRTQSRRWLWANWRPNMALWMSFILGINFGMRAAKEKSGNVLLLSTFWTSILLLIPKRRTHSPRLCGRSSRHFCAV